MMRATRMGAVALAIFTVSGASAAAIKGRGAPGRSRLTLGSRLRASRSPGSEKPGVPVRLELLPEGVGTEQEQRVRVIAEPIVPCLSLTLRAVARDGLEITRGPSAWSAGSTPKGGHVSRSLLLQAKRSGEQQFQVTATIVLTDGTRLTTSAGWAAHPRAPSLTQEFPGSQRVKDGKGRDILELPSR